MREIEIATGLTSEQVATVAAPAGTSPLAPAVRRCMLFCRTDQERHMSETDYCRTCPLVDWCVRDGAQ